MKSSIETLADRFRNAIEAAQETNEPGKLFVKFPRGCCGYVSDLLAQYLIEHEIGPIIYANGTFYSNDKDDPYDRQNHAWLEVDDFVIDITADQFINSRSLKNHVRVYVGEFTAWYALFEMNSGGRCDHNGIEKCWSNYDELISWYNVIKQYIGNSK